MFNGEGMAPRERFALMGEIVSRYIIEEHVTEVGDLPACGKFERKVFGGLDIVDISGANMRAQRTRAHIARSPSALYLVSIQLAGTNSFRWREQDVTVSPGDIFIVDSVHAYNVDGEQPF